MLGRVKAQERDDSSQNTRSTMTVLTGYRGGSAGPGKISVHLEQEETENGLQELDSAETKVAAVFPYINNSSCAWFICLFVCPVSANKRYNSSEQGLFSFTVFF